MKTVYLVLTIWVTVAGLIGGAGVNAAAERCGHPIKIESAFEWLAWPIIFAATVTADNASIAYTPCESMRGEQ